MNGITLLQFSSIFLAKNDASVTGWLIPFFIIAMHLESRTTKHVVRGVRRQITSLTRFSTRIVNGIFAYWGRTGILLRLIRLSFVSTVTLRTLTCSIIAELSCWLAEWKRHLHTLKEREKNCDIHILKLFLPSALKIHTDWIDVFLLLDEMKGEIDVHQIICKGQNGWKLPRCLIERRNEKQIWRPFCVSHGRRRTQ